MADTPEIVYYIALQQLYRNRLRMQHSLLQQYGNAEAVWQHLEEEGKAEAFSRALTEWDFIRQHHIHTYVYGREGYPYRLSQCPDAPVLLYGKGNLNLDNGHFVSVVGTRSASERGKELTRQLVLDLAQMVPDLTIISGLAYGIDVAAHRAALEAGIPTIIIPGHGLDRIYPYLHREVAVQALEKGGILTEYPTGTEPLAGNFVARDRLIAGMADAVVVVESKEKGGSLITARMAGDYNREVFTFPGRPSDVNNRGCNGLIKMNKAQLIENAADLAEAMMWCSPAGRQPMQTELTGLYQNLNPTEQLLLDKLHEQEDGIHVNLLVMESGLQYAEISSTLILMELNGLVKSLPGGIYRALK